MIIIRLSGPTGGFGTGDVTIEGISFVATRSRPPSRVNANGRGKKKRRRPVELTRANVM